MSSLCEGCVHSKICKDREAFQAVENLTLSFSSRIEIKDGKATEKEVYPTLKYAKVSKDLTERAISLKATCGNYLKYPRCKDEYDDDEEDF